ncbi:DUF1186 domain-containing protein [Thalassobaculum sp.]|uniref:DUF1186 domain-containing protein n=1 Tax=Thalassobaculum sp. TaxID=2022740 RepID=UPI0032EED74D
MERYDPHSAPEPEVWLALDEVLRTDLVEAHHRRARIRVPDLPLHAAIHTTVENQIALGRELPVRQTVERLMREGLDRHEALHAVGAEALRYIQDLALLADRPHPKAGGPREEAALAGYKAAVERLTADGWRASFDDGDSDDETRPPNIDAAIAELGRDSDRLPTGSMQWALDNWDQAAPRFLRMLEDYVAGADRTDGTVNALFLAVHLLGEKQETAAFPSLCRVLMEPDVAEDLLGDAITENLSRILVSTFDGDRLALRRVVEAADAEPFVRYAALDAMAYLTRTGRIPEDETRAYLGHLRQAMEPRADSPVWDGWAGAVANLGYAEFEAEVATLLEQGYIEPIATDMDWFRERVRLVRGDPEGLAGFAEDHIGPFEDAIGTLSSWASFSGEDDGYPGEDGFDDGLPPWPAADQPYVDPMRHVGRNDPCPCGSGKKYKKCCLR